MTYKKGILLVIVALVLLSAGGIGVNTYEEQNTVYKYHITSESISSYDESSAQDVSELAQSERELLKEAFSTTDGFFDGASTTIEREEKVDIKLDWDVIEVDGASAVVSISEETVEEPSERYSFSMLALILGALGFSIGAGMFYNARWNNGIGSSHSQYINLKDL